jgi:putative ABC transport system permease protein
VAEILRHFRRAVRALLRTPGFTLAALVTLALGIGSATALFSVVHRVLLRPLPYREPGRLVALMERQLSSGEEGSLSAPDFRDVRAEARAFEAVTIWRPRGFELSGLGRAERIRGMETSAGYLETLGYRPERGRFFAREDEDGSAVVIVSHGFWIRALGGDPAVVGRSLTLDGRAYTVLGVAPPDPPLPNGFQADVITALDWHVSPTKDRSDHTYRGLGLLHPGVSVAAVTTELEVLSGALADRYPTDVHREWPIVARNLRTHLLGDRTRPMLLLMGAASLLLLIACANVANLFLARAIGRSRDTAIRISLGAGIRSLSSTFFAESLPVGLAGGLLGLALSGVAIRFIRAWLPGSAELTGITRVGLNPAVAGFALLLAVATGTFFALAPLLQTRKLELVSELKEGGRSGSAGRGSLRSLLVVGEVAMSTVLLMASGLFLRSLIKVMDTPPGFQVRGLVTFNLLFPHGRYGSEDRVRSFQNDLVQRLRALPGVENVGTTCEAPLTGENDDTSFAVGDLARTVPPPGWPTTERDQVGGNYFETMRIPILKGRALNERDGVDSPRVVVVSESLARRYVKGDPIGQRMEHGQVSAASPPGTSFEIVGVAKDIRNSSQEKSPAPRIYMPFAQVPRRYLSVVLRTRQSSEELRRPLETVVASLDPQLPVGRIYSLEEQARVSTADRRQTTLLLGAFTFLALLLSGVGIFSVVSYMAAQNRREFGIRIAVGARGAQIVQLVLRRGFAPSVIGSVIGLVAAIGLGRVVSSRLYGVTSFDPATVGGSILILLVTSLLACGVPAVRAARISPLLALRAE